jgi:hypothetical protein
MIGFFLLFTLFIVIGSSFKTLINDGRNSAIVVLYLICQIFFNFGKYFMSLSFWVVVSTLPRNCILMDLLTSLDCLAL